MLKWDAQSCPTVCDPMDSSPPGFSVHIIFQARILEWVAISFSNTQGGRLFLWKYLTHHAPPPHCHSLPGSSWAVVICLQLVGSTQPRQQGHTSSSPLTDPVEGTLGFSVPWKDPVHLVSPPSSCSTGPSRAVSKTLCLTRSYLACQRTPCVQQPHHSHPEPPPPAAAWNSKGAVIVVVRSLGHVQPFVTPRTAARHASLSLTISWSLLKLTTIESVIRGFGGSLSSEQHDSLGLPSKGGL